MSDTEGIRITTIFCLQGDEEMARVSLEVFDVEFHGGRKPAISELIFIPMDGGEYGTAEWLRDVLTGLVEKL